MANKIVTTAMRDEAKLAHHGVKGQKWGVRRTPEQLGRRRPSSREKKETNIKGLDWNAVLPALGMGAAAMSLVSLAAPVVQLTAEVVQDLSINKMKKDPKRQVNSLKDAAKIKPPEDSSVSLMKVNKTRSKNSQYTNNCPNTTMAYELRRRGYDVSAKPNPSGSTMPAILNSYNLKKPSLTLEGFSSGTPEQKSAGITKVQKYLDKQSDGFRGAAIVSWGGTGAGHIFNIERRGGKSIFIDAQTGKSGEFNPKSEPKTQKNRSKPENYLYFSDSVAVIRTDNAKINESKLSDSVLKGK